MGQTGAPFRATVRVSHPREFHREPVGEMAQPLPGPVAEVTGLWGRRAHRSERPRK